MAYTIGLWPCDLIPLLAIYLLWLSILSFYLLEVIAPDRGGEQRVPQYNTKLHNACAPYYVRSISDSLYSVISDRKNNAGGPAGRQMRPQHAPTPRDKARNQANQAGPTERTKRSQRTEPQFPLSVPAEPTMGPGSF